jgi:hypothetical protein
MSLTYKLLGWRLTYHLLRLEGNGRARAFKMAALHHFFGRKAYLSPHKP